MQSHFSLDKLAIPGRGNFARECVGFAALCTIGYLLVSSSTTTNSYIALAAIFIAQFFFLYFLLFGSIFLAVFGVTTYLTIITTLGSYPVMYLLVCLLLLGVQLAIIVLSLKYSHRFFGDLLSLLGTIFFAISVAGFLTVVSYLSDSASIPTDPKVHSAGFRLVLLFLCAAQSIVLFSVLIRNDFARSLLEVLGPFRLKSLPGIFDTQIAVGIFSGSLIFSFIIFWDTFATVSGVVDTGKEYARVENSIIRNVIQTSASHRLAMSAVLVDEIEKYGYEEGSAVDIRDSFSGISNIRLGSSIQASRLVYEDKSREEPFNPQKIGAFMPTRVPGLFIAWNKDSAVLRTGAGNHGYIFTEMNLAEILPESPISWALIDNTNNQVIFRSKHSAKLREDIFLTTTNESDGRRQTPYLLQSAAGKEIGVTAESPLANILNTKLVTFVSLNESIDEIRAKMYFQIFLFWTVSLIFTVIAWRTNKKTDSMIDSQLQTVANWIPSSQSQLEAGPNAATRLDAKTKRLEGVTDETLGELRQKLDEAFDLHSDYAELIAMIESVEESQMIFVMSEQGRVVLSNKFAKTACGIADGQSLLPTSNMEAGMVSLRSAIYEVFDKARNQENSFLIEKHVREGKNDPGNYFLVGAHPYQKSYQDQDLGEKHFFISLINIDNYVANRKLAEHSSRLGLLGETVAGVAHEINQPLNTIRLATANATALLEDADNNREAIRKKLERRTSQVSRASSLIKTMKDHGRIAQEDISTLDLSQCVERAIKLYSVQLGLDNISVNYNIASVIPEVNASQLVIEQVIGNLLMNARDAIVVNNDRLKNETIYVDVRLSTDPKYTEVIVKNMGPAIPMEIQDRIFNPFFSTKKPGQDSGVGLGLSVSSRMMEEIGGKITLVSSKQETIFSMLFANAS